MAGRERGEQQFISESGYLELKYSELRAPRSKYPDLLAAWVLEHVFEQRGSLLDLGSGRGDHLAAFALLGFDVTGVDLARAAPELAGAFTVHRVDLEAEALPFADASFDFLFSKSVLEHIRNAASFLSGARRVLKPGGRIAIFTPSWRHMHAEAFFSEYTHVRPFTAPSLHEALILAGFEDVDVGYFRQLPFTWRHPWLLPPVAALGRLPLPYRPLRDAPWPGRLNTLIRFSREVLLLGVARAPASDSQSDSSATAA
jgi:SAM-dependent methyltransferase